MTTTTKHDGKLQRNLSEPFRQTRAIRDHSTNQVEANAKRFPCHFCNKEYSIKFHLKQHIRKIHEECDLNLHKNNIQQSKIKDMTYILNGEGDLKKTGQEDLKEYKCGSCRKSFSQEGNLKMHYHLIHEDNKNYKCDSCGKSFLTLQYLDRHLHHTLFWVGVQGGSIFFWPQEGV